MARKQDNLRFAILATDVVLLSLINGDLCVLLIDIINPDFKGKMGLPGGLVNPSETAVDSALRHVQTKGGVGEVHLEQLYTFSAIDRDPRGRVVSIAYFGLVTPYDSHKVNKKAQWVLVKKNRPLAYDHSEIVNVAVQRLRNKLTYTNVVRHLLPNEFTLPELQKVYEVILGQDLDKRNFRKKILKLNLVKKTNKEKRGGASRPAVLYKWTSNKDQIVNLL